MAETNNINTNGAAQATAALRTPRAQKREVAKKNESGLSVRDLILIAVLLAAGAVLKLTVSSFFSFAGMKPNFIIAMYCLAIILVRPKLGQSLVIGLLAGLICQIPMLNATPWVNIPSEMLGALACGLLIHVPMRIAGKVDLNPLVTTFLSTAVSGYTFALIVGVALNGLSLPVTLVTYAVMVFGTATVNCILVAILTLPLKKVLTFQYAESTAPTLHDINLTLAPGTFLGITGAAGSGKSTLTYAFNGIIPHCYPGDFYGSVHVCGLDTVEADLTSISRLVGSVCQDIDSQMVSSVVEDEILYGLENFGVQKDQIEHRLAASLEAMGIEALRDRTIDSLSGGQKQKVALASIIALEPRVLVLDEPTAELDPVSSVGVFKLLKDYAQKSNTTIVVVEQKIALLSHYADLLLVLDQGTIRFCDTPEAVLAHSAELLEIGINCPRSTSLINQLRHDGFYRGPSVRDVEGACNVCKEVLA